MLVIPREAITPYNVSRKGLAFLVKSRRLGDYTQNSIFIIMDVFRRFNKSLIKSFSFNLS